MARHCYVLRVFTRDDSGGNGLGVVTDILGLDDAKMQQIATNLGFSETIFLSWFDGVMPKARIFTPKVELPFAGHPLVGAAWILINLGPVDPGAIECSVGTVRIRQDDGVTWIDGAGGQPVRTVSPDLGPSLMRLGIDAVDIAEVLMPSPYRLVQVGRPDDVAAVTPSTLAEFGDVYVWAWEEEGETVRSRFFAPGFGVGEDPATGSAAFALAARLRDLGRDQGNLVIHQGEEMGHPSRINLVWNDYGTSIGGTVARDEVLFLKI
jgi:trans-2,3-dihydro-3-hydroxyanthranilate isomerase